MRVSAYILVADPAFLRASVSAYYDRVERIVLSYDETATSWTGTALPVDECLQAIADLDVDGKFMYAPGAYARLDHDPLDNDTFQRQSALDLASAHGDWVLQLDTDEVLLDPDRFFAAIARADATGCDALHYPARWLYTRTRPGRYLESSSRWWGPSSGYPGALAVRSGTALQTARQTAAPTYRVDVRPWNTDPSHHHETVVHEVVPPRSAVAHFSWVRDDATMRRKFGWSGHAAEYLHPVVYRRWAAAGRHPLRTVLTTPLRRDRWFRFGVVPEPAEERVVAS